MRYSASAHTRFYHRFHVVWGTKYRYKVLEGLMRERIREIIIQTCEDLGVHIVKGVLARDHVHMFLSIPPKLSLSYQRPYGLTVFAYSRSLIERTRSGSFAKKFHALQHRTRMSS